MNAQDIIPALLLTLLSLALTSGAAILLLFMHWRRNNARSHHQQLGERLLRLDAFNTLTPQLFSQRPETWIAVRSRSLESVQEALHLNNPRPCSWLQGLTGEFKLFIAPPIHGWILITGFGLPDPFEDVDACFRCLLRLSEKLGHIQLFSASPALSHHAWVRAESGRIHRAYAWAGKTIWNQGALTQAEKDLDMKCFQYFEASDATTFETNEVAACNTEKVAQLASRWSIDPATIDESTLDHTCGIAGEPPRLY